MALVDVALYRTLTGDDTTASAAVEVALAEAQELLEDELRRPLESAERTERLQIHEGNRVYPSAVPITDPGDYTAEGDALVGATAAGVFPSYAWPPSAPLYASVTYTGGWTAETVPATIARDIAMAAQRLMTTASVVTEIPVGATSVALGDASISFGGGGYSGGVRIGTVAWSLGTLRYRRRFL